MSSRLLRLTRNSSFNSAQQLWLAALSLVGTPIIYHGLGPDEYGLFAIVNVIAAQLYVLEFGFGHATTKFVAGALARGEEDAVSRIVSTSAVVFLAGGALGAAIIAGGSGFLVRSYFVVPDELLALARRVLLLGAILFFISFQSNLFGGVWGGLQRFGTRSLVGGAAGTAQVAGAILIVLVGGGVDDVVLWTTGVAIASAAAHVLLLGRVTPRISVVPRFDRDVFRRMWRYGLLLMVVGIFSQIYLSGGALALGYFVPVGLLPFYAIPLTVYQKLTRLAGGFAAALFPLVAEAAESGEGEVLHRIAVGGARILLVAAIPLTAGGVLLSGPFLTWWMGAGFAAGATPVLQAFFLAFGITLICIPGTELARGGGRPEVLAYYTGVLAAGNVLGTMALAPLFGVVGAAAAMALSQAVGAVLLIGIGGARGPLLRALVAPALVGVPLVLSFLGVGVLVDGFWARALPAFLLTCGYGWLAFRLGLGPAERAALRGAFGRQAEGKG